MKIPILVFDFDGTIADTHHFIVQISNQLAKEYNFSQMTSEEAEMLKDKTTQEIIKHLNVPFLKIPAILARAKLEFSKGVDALSPFAGLKEILWDLKRSGIALGILSSNSLENVARFLENNQINMFDFIQTTTKVWSKDTSLRKLMKQRGFSAQEVLYVGDEVRDITAAKRLGVRVAAVTWGYNYSNCLKKHQPDFLLDKPQDLLKFLS